MNIENQLKGLTIEQATAKIQKIESKSETFMIHVVERKEVFKDFKQYFKNHHLRDKDGKRIYYTTNNTYYYFANDKTLENQNKIIDIKIEKGQHSNFGFNGWESDGIHNEYYLIVEKVSKGNKSKRILHSCDKKIYQYKDGELTKKQRRFVL